MKGIHLKLVTYFVIDMKTFDGQKNTLNYPGYVRLTNVNAFQKLMRTIVKQSLKREKET